MKRWILLSLAIIVLPFTLNAQEAGQVGCLSVGGFLTSGQPTTVAYFVGANAKLPGINVSSFRVVENDTIVNFHTYQRIGYFSENEPGDSTELQAASAWYLTHIAFSKQWSFAFGPGGYYEIKDGTDQSSTGIKFELGWHPFDKFNIGVGCDIYGNKGGQPDDFFPYLNVGILDLSL